MISRLNIFVSSAGLLLCAIVGCGAGPEAVFVISERTEKLVPEARKQVKTTLDENFGTSNNLVAWMQLPVDFGGYRGQVAAAPADGKDAGTKSFGVKFADDAGTKFATAAAADHSNPKIVFLTGDFAGSSATLDGFAAETNTLTTVEPFDKAPQEGDQFIVQPGAQLQYGRQLYMTHCMHCHGVSGDGNGPTARYLNPRPRDYRDGFFKFTSTKQPEKPQAEDLHRIIRQGIPGTYMPSFLLLKDDELQAITEYITWLSIRGEVEGKIDAELEFEGYSKSAVAANTSGENAVSRDEIINNLTTYLKESYPEAVTNAADEVGESWTRAQEEESVVIPTSKRTPPDAASIARGRHLYLTKATCADCHGVTGRGDGPQTIQILKDKVTNEDNPGPGLYDSWGNKIVPRNLTKPTYRGGRRPVDIYRRIHAGIKGTPMPAFGTALTNEEIWDVVNYAMSIPFDGKESAAPPEQAEATMADNEAHE